MEPSFWLSRWSEGKIGFHEDRVHPDLFDFGADWLSRAPGGPRKRVLVPLCGKTRDLVYLANLGHAVVGIELSEKAARAVFTEAGLRFDSSTRGAFEVFRAKSLDLEVRVGDFFDLLAQPNFHAVWDRAAMVALDPERRARYAERLIDVVRPGGMMLVNTMEYDQAQMPGPPHAISFQDLKGYYGRDFELELLQEADQIDESPKFRERGLSSFVVRTTLLTRN